MMKGYGEHWQLSVFFCVLKEIDRVRMQADLESVMNLKDDQALIIDMGANEQAARRLVAVIGSRLPETPDGVLVI